ncbi:hypothetical protein [Methanolobus halotolerans]|uniref:Uncharacterized protein n=1 Tax=Methanolobus halotolerans TaxID=2052935 RepID=A0A4E0PTE7_9EURY|nr:hypothetical protein [Methanolobus halotolerans]TGC08013.1 hypothetical protein CUN85_10245 [Methanolobus halotolerans]
MGIAKSGGYKGRPIGSTKDRYWLSEGHRKSRYNHAMDFCELTIDQITICPVCQRLGAKCIEAHVTKSLGARSNWRCVCGHQFTRSITPEKMVQYYAEDLKRMIESNAREATL